MIELPHDWSAQDGRLKSEVIKIVTEAAGIDNKTDTAHQGSRKRWLAYYALKKRGWTLNRIGDVFGKDHTTVLHGIKKIEAQLHQ